MKRFLATLLVLALVGAALTGCAAKLPEQDEALPPQNAEQATAKEVQLVEEHVEPEAETRTPQELLDVYLGRDNAPAQAAEELLQQPEQAAALAMQELLALPEGSLFDAASGDTEAGKLYRLFARALAGDTVRWNADESEYLNGNLNESTSSVTDLLTSYFFFVSTHYREDGMVWLDENMPVSASVLRAAWEADASLRLAMTPCAPITNGGALENAKRVFAAALRHDTQALTAYGYLGLLPDWPVDTSGDWTLSQDDDGAVTLRFAADVLRYTPGAAEKQSRSAGYGMVEYLPADGEAEQMQAAGFGKEAADLTDLSQPLRDGEMTLSNGVQLGLDYETVLALLGEGAQVLSNGGLEADGVEYSFYQGNGLVRRLYSVSYRLAEDTWLGKTSQLAAPRDIHLGDTMQSVFDKIPGDTALRQWEFQDVYGPNDDGSAANLQFVASSFYSLNLTTAGGQTMSITFARADGSVKWIDLMMD